MFKIIQENGGRYEEFFIRYEHLCKDIMDVLEDDGFRDQITRDFTKDHFGLIVQDRAEPYRNLHRQRDRSRRS